MAQGTKELRGSHGGHWGPHPSAETAGGTDRARPLPLPSSGRGAGRVAPPPPRPVPGCGRQPAAAALRERLLRGCSASVTPASGKCGRALRGAQSDTGSPLDGAGSLGAGGSSSPNPAPSGKSVHSHCSGSSVSQSHSAHSPVLPSCRWGLRALRSWPSSLWSLGQRRGGKAPSVGSHLEGVHSSRSLASQWHQNHVPLKSYVARHPGRGHFGGTPE